jgi:hypothetical protein
VKTLICLKFALIRQLLSGTFSQDCASSPVLRAP